MTRTFVAALVALSLPMTAFAEGSLVGRWEGSASPNEYLTYRFSVALLADGRYATRMLIGEAPIDASGTYRVDGDRLVMTPAGAAPIGYAMVLRGDTLELRGGDLESLQIASLALRKVPGSEQAVAKEAQAADAARSRADDAWKQRIPLARVQPGPNVALGEIPADAGWKRVFEGATVFRDGATYLRWNVNQRWSLRDRTPPNGGYSGINWHFHGNGRVYFHSVMYVGSGVPGTAVSVDDRGYWGRYRVDGDRVSIDMDSGEKHELTLIDGRRNLRWGDSVYGHLAWENEAIQGR